jgi:molybdenum cofactor biosynthesis protein B
MKREKQEHHPHVRDVPITIAIITVSTTRSMETDLSGRIIRELCEEASMPIAHYAVVPDRITEIREEFFRAAATADCIICSGGTGLTKDDCTIEAISPLLDRVLNGFGEIFRWRSYGEIGAAAVLSRAIGGISSGKAVFCIPGSPEAARLAVSEIIIPVARHMISHAKA